MPNLPTRIANAWNAFKRPFTEFVPSIGSSYGAYPLGRHYNVTNEQTFVSGLYNRVAMDVSAVDIAIFAWSRTVVNTSLTFRTISIHA